MYRSVLVQSVPKNYTLTNEYGYVLIIVISKLPCRVHGTITLLCLPVTRLRWIMLTTLDDVFAVVFRVRAFLQARASPVRLTPHGCDFGGCGFGSCSGSGSACRLLQK